MRKTVTYYFMLLALVACVPVAKYNMAQNELRQTQESNHHVKLSLDSLNKDFRVLKGDYNSLAFELEETQRYSSFSNIELAKQLNVEKNERIQLANYIDQQIVNEKYIAWISAQRAASFSADANCALSPFASKNFLIIDENKILLDLEGLMESSKEKQMDLKTALVDFLKPMKSRDDWEMKLCLYQGGNAADWHKITLQNEVLGFFVHDVALPMDRVQSVTKILSEKSSLEFGFKNSSRLFVEIEFIG